MESGATFAISGADRRIVEPVIGFLAAVFVAICSICSSTDSSGELVIGRVGVKRRDLVVAQKPFFKQGREERTEFVVLF